MQDHGLCFYVLVLLCFQWGIAFLKLIYSVFKHETICIIVDL
jgi:hypothetical protein